MKIFTIGIMALLAAISVFSLTFIACGDDDDDDDDDDNDDGVDRLQECYDNIGDCPVVTSSECNLCPEKETVQALWHTAQEEIGNVYCHSCGEEDGETFMTAFSTGAGCLDEATILDIFCE